MPSGRRLDRHLADVEAEVVEPLHALGEPPGLVGAEGLAVGERRPQRVVRRHDAVGDRERVDAALEPAARLEVHDLAGDVGAGDVEVVLALTAGEAALVQLAGLGVDEVGGERAGVAPEQRVRQRDVAPEEPDVVQPHEQHREGVDEARGGVGTQHLREQRAVGERELEVGGDEGGGERLALGIRASGDDGDALDARRVQAREVAEHVVLAAGHLLGRLLDRDDAAREVREAHQVAREALGQEDDVARRPLGERRRPGKGQQRRIDPARGDARVRLASILLRGSVRHCVAPLSTTRRGSPSGYPRRVDADAVDRGDDRVVEALAALEVERVDVSRRSPRG